MKIIHQVAVLFAIVAMCGSCDSRAKSEQYETDESQVLQAKVSILCMMVPSQATRMLQMSDEAMVEAAHATSIWFKQLCEDMQQEADMIQNGGGTTANIRDALRRLESRESR